MGADSDPEFSRDGGLRVEVLAVRARAETTLVDTQIEVPHDAQRNRRRIFDALEEGPSSANLRGIVSPSSKRAEILRNAEAAQPEKGVGRHAASELDDEFQIRNRH